MAGADDHLYAPGDLDAIEAALATAGVPHELVVYPDTPHGFACFERDTYREKEAADGWRAGLRAARGKLRHQKQSSCALAGRKCYRL